MCSATLSWAKAEFPRAGGGRTSLTLISSQLKGLMLSHARGMLCDRMGMTFLPESSIPAEPKLGSLLLLQPPADHTPSGASPGSPYWSGEGRRASLLCLPYKPSHCIWWNKTALLGNWSLFAPLGERTEARVTFLFLPCSCWFTPPASHIPPLSAACLQKPSFILGNGEKSEPGLVATGTKPHLGWGETRGPTGGFSFPVNTQIVLVFGSSGRKTVGECKEKGARAGRVQMLVF